MREKVLPVFRYLLRVSPVVWFMAGTLLFLIDRHNRYIDWRQIRGEKKTIFFSDADQYYSYLPSLLIHRDPNVTYTDRYWYTSLPNGNKLNKFTYGVAFLELPWFLAGHLVASGFDYPADGYSAPYIWSVILGVIFYVLVGLYLLYRSLKLFFHPWVAVVTLFALFYCTNLFFYTLGAGAMSHSFLFFTNSLFLWGTVNWMRKQKFKYMLVIACSGAFSVLIRPTEITIFLLPLLLPAGMENSLDFRKKWAMISGNWKQILGGLALGFCVFLPQMIYWKIQTGSFLFYSYTDEKFYLSDPKLWQIFFGYRNSVFPYSPILILVLVGFGFILWKRKSWFPALFFQFLINAYLLSCWWDYGFGGSFGSRVFVQSYVFWAIPMAMVFSLALTGIRHTFWKWVPVGFTLGLLWFASSTYFIMHRQFLRGEIHYSAMNKEWYWAVFRKIPVEKEVFLRLYQNMKEPDYERLKAGYRSD